MTAQPVLREDLPAPWSPDPTRQRLARYTVEDVLNLPDDAPRVELDDGVMIVVPSPTFGHQDICSLLWNWFRRHAPERLRPFVAVGVLIDVKSTFEPDVLLAHHDAEHMVDLGSHYIAPEQVAIAVAVVSPGTRRRDRFAKPASYAAVGIPFYWRVEQNPVHIFAYKLGKNGVYELVADSAELLELSEPFAIKLPVSEIEP